MREERFFEAGTIPEYCTAAWYAGRDAAPHIDEPAHQGRLAQTRRYVHMSCEQRDSVVDLGAGDGGLLSTLHRDIQPRAWGYDLQPSNVDAAARRGVDVRYGDVINGDIDWGSIAVCTEMLEHLVDPHAFVRRIRDAGCRVLVASSPAFETAESHYAFHTWGWDVDGYVALLNQGGYDVTDYTVVDGMFQVHLATATP